jgi:colicin import membrane protein
MRSYSLAIILSMIGHGLLVFLVVWGWSASVEKTVVKKPSYIKATLVQLDQKSKPVVKKISPPKVDDSLKKKQQEAAKKKRDAALKAQKKKAAEAQAKKDQALKEKTRKNQLAKKRAEEEKKKKAAERKQKEQEKKLEKELSEQRKAALQKEIEDERQRELEQSVAAENKRIEDAKQSASDAVLVTSYESIIDKRVSANWSRPPSARNGMSALLRIQLVPTGRVVNVNVIESSGDAAFDRSAEQAVNKAESFPELKKLPNRVFEKNFRVFNLNFEPEDLRQ